MDIPNGVQVWVPKGDLDECLKMAIKMWLNEYPHESQLFGNHLREKRDNLHRVNGMTKQGMFKEYLEIPVNLGKNIRQMTHKDWMQDKQITDRIRQLMPGLKPHGKDESRVII